MYCVDLRDGPGGMDRCKRKAMAQGLAAWASAPIKQMAKGWGWIWALASAALWLAAAFWVAFDPFEPFGAEAKAAQFHTAGMQEDAASKAQSAWENAGKPLPGIRWKVWPDGSATGTMEIRLPAGSVGVAGQEVGSLPAGGAGGGKRLALWWLGACMALYGLGMSWSYMAGIRRRLGSWRAAARAWDAQGLAEHLEGPCAQLWARIDCAQATGRFFSILCAGSMAGLGAAFTIGSGACSLAAAAAGAGLAAAAALAMAAGPAIAWAAGRAEISGIGLALAWAGCAIWAYAICKRLLIPGCRALAGGWLGKAASGARVRTKEFCGRLESMGRGAYAQEERALLAEGCQKEGKRAEKGKKARL